MNTPRFLVRLAGAATVLVAMLAATLAFAPSSTAAPTAEVVSASTTTSHTTSRVGCRKKCFGAIFVNVTTGVARGVVNYPTKKKALNKAKKNCRQASSGNGKCVRAVWTRNACMAVAARVKNNTLVQWQGRWDNKLKKAKKKAKRALKGPGKRKIWISGCTAN